MNLGFPLASMSCEADYSSTSIILFNNNSNCGHRNMKLLENGPIALTFNTDAYNLLPELLRQLCPLPSLVHVWCGAQSDATQ